MLARLFTARKIIPLKFAQNLVAFIDSRMIESAEAVVHSNDFGVSITFNLTAGIFSPAHLNKKMNVKFMGDRGGFLYGAGVGFNIGFVPSEKSAYLEVTGDLENLNEAMTPLVQLEQSTRAFFYARSSNHKNMSPVEVGRKTDLPIPLITGMNTDRGFYVGASYGPSLFPALPKILKNVVFPILDQIAVYATDIHRVHLLRIAAQGGDTKTALSFSFPILRHPIFESSDTLIAAIHSAKEKVKTHFSRVEDRILDAWPDTPSCVIVLGISKF